MIKGMVNSRKMGKTLKAEIGNDIDIQKNIFQGLYLSDTANASANRSLSVRPFSIYSQFGPNRERIS